MTQTTLEAHTEYLRKLGVSERSIEKLLGEQEELQTIGDLTGEKKACIEFILNNYDIQEDIISPGKSGKLRNLLERAEEIKDIYNATRAIMGRKPPIWALLSIKQEYMPTVEDIRKNAAYLQAYVGKMDKEDFVKQCYDNNEIFSLMFMPHRIFEKGIAKATKYK